MMHHSIDYQLESQDSDRTWFEAGRTALCSNSERIVYFRWRSNDLDEVVSDHHSVMQRSQECMDDDDIFILLCQEAEYYLCPGKHAMPIFASKFDQQSLTTCSLPAPQAGVEPQVLVAQQFVHGSGACMH